MLCDSREGSDREADGRGFRKEGTHGYLCLSHVVIGRNEHNMQSIIPQLKITKKKAGKLY